MRAFVAVVLAVALVLYGCSPESRPFPVLAGTDASDASLPDASEASVPRDDNAYVCACVAYLPVECVWGCGTIGSGTAASGGHCDFGLRHVTTCVPGTEARTHAELQADCSGRVQAVLGRALTAIYGSCAECRLRIGCSAVRYDGTVETRREARCDEPCAATPLGFSTEWNYRTATYVPAGVGEACQSTGDTPQLCGWL
jgi:hypothetical protein